MTDKIPKQRLSFTSVRTPILKPIKSDKTPINKNFNENSLNLNDLYFYKKEEVLDNNNINVKDKKYGNNTSTILKMTKEMIKNNKKYYNYLSKYSKFIKIPKFKTPDIENYPVYTNFEYVSLQTLNETKFVDYNSTNYTTVNKKSKAFSLKNKEKENKKENDKDINENANKILNTEHSDFSSVNIVKANLIEKDEKNVVKHSYDNSNNNFHNKSLSLFLYNKNQSLSSIFGNSIKGKDAIKLLEVISGNPITFYSQYFDISNYISENYIEKSISHLKTNSNFYGTYNAINSLNSNKHNHTKSLMSLISYNITDTKQEDIGLKENKERNYDSDENSQVSNKNSDTKELFFEKDKINKVSGYLNLNTPNSISKNQVNNIEKKINNGIKGSSKIENNLSSTYLPKNLNYNQNIFNEWDFNSYLDKNFDNMFNQLFDNYDGDKVKYFQLKDKEGVSSNLEFCTNNLKDNLKLKVTSLELKIVDDNCNLVYETVLPFKLLFLFYRLQELEFFSLISQLISVTGLSDDCASTSTEIPVKDNNTTKDSRIEEDPFKISWSSFLIVLNLIYFKRKDAVPIYSPINKERKNLESKIPIYSTQYNRFSTDLFYKEMRYLLTIEGPKIEVSYGKNSIIKHIKPEVILFLMNKNFIDWEYYCLCYMSEFKKFRNIFSDLVSNRISTQSFTLNPKNSNCFNPKFGMITFSKLSKANKAKYVFPQYNHEKEKNSYYLEDIKLKYISKDDLEYKFIIVGKQGVIFQKISSFSCFVEKEDKAQLNLYLREFCFNLGHIKKIEEIKNYYHIDDFFNKFFQVKCEENITNSEFRNTTKNKSDNMIKVQIGNDAIIEDDCLQSVDSVTEQNLNILNEDKKQEVELNKENSTQAQKNLASQKSIKNKKNFTTFNLSKIKKNIMNSSKLVDKANYLKSDEIKKMKNLPSNEVTSPKLSSFNFNEENTPIKTKFKEALHSVVNQNFHNSMNGFAESKPQNKINEGPIRKLFDQINDKFSFEVSFDYNKFDELNTYFINTFPIKEKINTNKTIDLLKLDNKSNNKKFDNNENNKDIRKLILVENLQNKYTHDHNLLYYSLLASKNFSFKISEIKNPCVHKICFTPKREFKKESYGKIDSIIYLDFNKTNLDEWHLIIIKYFNFFARKINETQNNLMKNKSIKMQYCGKEKTSLVDKYARKKSKLFEFTGGVKDPNLNISPTISKPNLNHNQLSPEILKNKSNFKIKCETNDNVLAYNFNNLSNSNQLYLKNIDSKKQFSHINLAQKNESIDKTNSTNSFISIINNNKETNFKNDANKELVSSKNSSKPKTKVTILENNLILQENKNNKGSTSSNEVKTDKDKAKNERKSLFSNENINFIPKQTEIQDGDYKNEIEMKKIKQKAKNLRELSAL